MSAQILRLRQQIHRALIVEPVGRGMWRAVVRNRSGEIELLHHSIPAGERVAVQTAARSISERFGLPTLIRNVSGKVVAMRRERAI